MNLCLKCYKKDQHICELQAENQFNSNEIDELIDALSDSRSEMEEYRDAWREKVKLLELLKEQYVYIKQMKDELLTEFNSSRNRLESLLWDCRRQIESEVSTSSRLREELRDVTRARDTHYDFILENHLDEYLSWLDRPRSNEDWGEYI